MQSVRPRNLRGKQWDANKGEPNRQEFRQLVRAGRVYGVLAFDGETPVGWCRIGPRGEFERLQASKVLATERPPETWGVTCFFIPTKQRGRGVATQLLKSAAGLAKELGAPALEGYPVSPSKSGGDVPAAFAWTGVPTLFERAGFRDVTPAGRSRPIYLRRFRQTSR